MKISNTEINELNKKFYFEIPKNINNSEYMLISIDGIIETILLTNEINNNYIVNIDLKKFNIFETNVNNNIKKSVIKDLVITYYFISGNYNQLKELGKYNLYSIQAGENFNSMIIYKYSYKNGYFNNFEKEIYKMADNYFKELNEYKNFDNSYEKLHIHLIPLGLNQKPKDVYIPNFSFYGKTIFLYLRPVVNTSDYYQGYSITEKNKFNQCFLHEFSHYIQNNFLQNNFYLNQNKIESCSQALENIYFPETNEVNTNFILHNLKKLIEEKIDNINDFFSIKTNDNYRFSPFLLYIALISNDSTKFLKNFVESFDINKLLEYYETNNKYNYIDNNINKSEIYKQFVIEVNKWETSNNYVVKTKYININKDSKYFQNPPYNAITNNFNINISGILPFLPLSSLSSKSYKITLKEDEILTVNNTSSKSEMIVMYNNDKEYDLIKNNSKEFYIVTKETDYKILLINNNYEEDDTFIGKPIIVTMKIDLSFVPNSGTYPKGEEISIVNSANLENVMIKYTINGTKPSKDNGLVFDKSSPIILNNDLSIKAYAYIEENGEIISESEVISANYIINLATQYKFEGIVFDSSSNNEKLQEVEFYINNILVDTSLSDGSFSFYSDNKEIILVLKKEGYKDQTKTVNYDDIQMFGLYIFLEKEIVETYFPDEVTGKITIKFDQENIEHVISIKMNKSSKTDNNYYYGVLTGDNINSNEIIINKYNHSAYGFIDIILDENSSNTTRFTIKKSDIVYSSSKGHYINYLFLNNESVGIINLQINGY
jgi:hypothetical protein